MSRATSSRLGTSSKGMGTDGYRAPELVMSDEESKYRYSAKTDMWAVGCVYYKLLVGTNAFPNDYAVLEYYKASDPPIAMPLAKLVPDREFYRATSNEMLRGLLNKNPSERPTASEYMDELVNMLRVAKERSISVPGIELLDFLVLEQCGEQLRDIVDAFYRVQLSENSDLPKRLIISKESPLLPLGQSFSDPCMLLSIDMRGKLADCLLPGEFEAFLELNSVKDGRADFLEIPGEHFCGMAGLEQEDTILWMKGNYITSITVIGLVLNRNVTFSFEETEGHSVWTDPGTQSPVMKQETAANDLLCSVSTYHRPRVSHEDLPNSMLAYHCSGRSHPGALETKAFSKSEAQDIRRDFLREVNVPGYLHLISRCVANCGDIPTNPRE
jgi:Protein kinase domain